MPSNNDSEVTYNISNDNDNIYYLLKRKIIYIIILLLIIGLSILVSFLVNIHTVDEGFVGIYYIGGALSTTVTRPGFHIKSPITEFHQVQITVQTDKVENVKCLTADGINLVFEKVEVINILNYNSVIPIIANYTINYDKPLIFEKIYHELNQICTKRTAEDIIIRNFSNIDDVLKDSLQAFINTYAKGIEIIGVRVDRPNIPSSILEKYEKRELARLQKEIEQKNGEAEKTKSKYAKEVEEINTEKNVSINLIRERGIKNAFEIKYNISEIENNIMKEKEKAKSEAKLYSVELEAKGNEKLFSKNYITILGLKSINNNSKIYFGKDLPNQSLIPVHD